MRPHVRNPFSRSISLGVPILGNEPGNSSESSSYPPESESSVPTNSSFEPCSESVPVSLGSVEVAAPPRPKINTTANETREIVWAVYKSKPWCAPYKEVMKTWNSVAEDLKARGICTDSRDGQYIRRRILSLIEIHHDPKKKWKFFATEETKALLEGAIERISHEWDISEENKRTRTTEKRKADDLREREGEILRISAVSPLIRTSAVSLDPESFRNNNQAEQQAYTSTTSSKRQRGPGKGSKFSRVTKKKQRISSEFVSQLEENGDTRVTGSSMHSGCQCPNSSSESLVEEIKTLRETVGKIETVMNRFIETVEKNSN